MTTPITPLEQLEQRIQEAEAELERLRELWRIEATRELEKQARLFEVES